MAATEILAAGTTNATSAVVTLVSGAKANLVLFTASGNVPRDCIFDVKIATSSGNPSVLKRISAGEISCQVEGPGDFTVERISVGKAGTPIGVDKNV